MIRLTLRTLLAYIDDTLEPEQARALGKKVAESEDAKQLIERIKKVTRRRGLRTPIPTGTEDDVSDPNVVAEYLSDNLDSEQIRHLEATCLASDVNLAEVAACHQILTLLLTEPVRVPPSANQRMYSLVEPPAADPRRKPGKTLPVGGAAPPVMTGAEVDDPDAALLLGMQRYAAADSWAGRVGWVGAVVTIAVFLAIAVLMALPRNPPAGPEMSRSPDYALAPVVVPNGPAIPHPREIDAGKKDPIDAGKVDPGKIVLVDPGKKDPGPGLNDPVAVPIEGRAAIGKMETPNVIVLTRGPEPAATWLRLDGATAQVLASDPVIALPGYKADVKLDTDVVVHLWGNVPEQMAMKAMVMQSRVRFHPPAMGFDADFSLDAGRVYLTARKPAGAKIRVRFAGQTWDVALPNDKTEVMVQAHTYFAPGTAYTREGGEKPWTEARLAVVRGTADFAAPGRFKKFDKIAEWTELTWASNTGTLTEPKSVEKDDPSLARIVLVEAEQGKAVQRALSDTATKLTQKDGIRVVLKERLTSADAPANVLSTKFAAYAQVAIADGPDAQDLIKELIDMLGDRTRWYARQAAVIAVSGWLPRSADNTAIFVRGLTTKGYLEEDADLLAQLLRGYAASGDPSAVDKLIEYLDHPNIAIREAALGNLIAYFDPEAARNPDLVGVSVAARGEPVYDKVLKAWKARGEEIKKKLSDKKAAEKK